MSYRLRNEGDLYVSDKDQVRPRRDPRRIAGLFGGAIGMLLLEACTLGKSPTPVILAQKATNQTHYLVFPLTVKRVSANKPTKQGC